MSINISHEFGILVNIGFVFSKSNILSLNENNIRWRNREEEKKKIKGWNIMKYRHLQNKRNTIFFPFWRLKYRTSLYPFSVFLLWAHNAKDLVLGGFSPHPMPPPSSSFLIKADLQSTSPSFPGNFCHWAQCKAVVWISFTHNGIYRASLSYSNPT